MTFSSRDTLATKSRRTLAFASVTHVWSDLFFALFVPLLIRIKTDPELGLSYTEAAFLKSAYAGASAVLQVPSGFLAERVGEFWLLVGGNIWVAAGLVAMAAASSFPLLLTSTILGGLGGGTQHPLATSMVSRAYDETGRATAVGTVNFAGDLGKMLSPIFALLVAIRFGWRTTMRVVGLSGIAFMAITVLARKSVDPGKPTAEKTGGQSANGDVRRNGGFINLSAVGFLDSAARSSALYLLPFVMVQKGISPWQIDGLLLLLLAGGATGKFAFGWLNDRYGPVPLIWGTKGLTALVLLAILPVPALAMAPLVFLVGIGLNGTSSVLYATLATLVPPRRRSRFYSFYYTTNEGASVLGPLFYGQIADLLDIRASMLALCFLITMILPASLPLRKYLPSTKPTAQGGQK